MWDAQENEQDFIQAIIPHLVKGIDHFKMLTSILLHYNESEDQAIQQVILMGKENLDRADSAASAELSKVDQIMETLTARKGQLDRQRADKTTELENLKTESQSIAESIEKTWAALDDAQRSLDSAQGTITDLQSKNTSSKIVLGVGAGLMVIPIIGTIIGGIMVGVSAKELKDAKQAMEIVEEEMKKSERAFNDFTVQVEEKTRQSVQKKDEIAECERTIEQIQQDLEQVYAQRMNIPEAEQKIRNAVHMLGTLAGRVRVAKTLTERVVCLPEIVNVLGEIIQKMLEIQGNRNCELLNDPDVRAAICSLQDVYRNVSAVDEQHTLREIPFPKEPKKKEASWLVCLPRSCWMPKRRWKLRRKK
ncbi:hypothetical protein GJAV_G00156390 [Gymnothorax javanicus]|nr:hypothetical protein GJAV_G00156390 [Gymnothorax javanicus]